MRLIYFTSLILILGFLSLAAQGSTSTSTVDSISSQSVYSPTSQSTEWLDRSLLSASVDVGARYVYNIFFDSLRTINDETLGVRPDVKLQTKPGSFFVEAEGEGLYEQFLTYSVQNHFDGTGKISAVINGEGNQSFKIFGNYKSFSDPSPDESFGRIGRQMVTGGLDGNFKVSRSSTVNVLVQAGQEQFNIPQIATHYLDNSSFDAIVQYNNAFLPETNWFLRGSGGMRQFPNKTVDPGDANSNLADYAPKNDSEYLSAELGFVGRLTEKSSIDSAVGWLARGYSNDSSNSASFSAPIFYLRFIEQISRQEQFMVGYNYTVTDSYYTNYLLNQEIYTGIVQVFGDQIVLLSKISYEYKSYSLPDRRDDERITGGFMMKYSVSPNVKLTADLKVDLLSSDAYYNHDSTFTGFNPDRPASYNAGSFGIGLMAAY